MYPFVLQWAKVTPVSDVTCQDFYEDWLYDYDYDYSGDWIVTADMICVGEG